MVDNSSLGIIICKNYYKELNFVLKENNYSNIRVATYDATCATNDKRNHENFNTALQKLRTKTNHIEIIGAELCAKCIGESAKKNIEDSCSLPDNCTDYFISKSLLDQFISENYYIITPGWLNSWELLVKERWGFDKKNARLFFKDTAKQILVLDTGVYPDFEKKLIAFSEFVGLPYKILNTGIDYFQLKVEKLIDNRMIKQSEARIKEDLNKKNQKLANYAMLFDIIPKIAVFITEKQLINSVLELLQMLFSPQEIVYVSIKDEKIVDIVTSSSEKKYDKHTIRKLFDFSEIYQTTENKKGLKIKVSYNNEVVAFILIENILFPEYLNSYYQELNTITTFLGLFMVNSRQHLELLNAKNSIEVNETKLKESNRAKDKFLSIIGHDLKGPFATIISFVELLHSNYETYSIEDRKKYMNIILEGLKDIYKLLENLLVWSQSQRGSISFKPQLINLFTFTEEILTVFDQTTKKKSISITNQIPDQIHVEADNQMLSTIFRNLISNALKFTPKNGAVSINARLEKNKNKTHVKVIVKDTGVGIDGDMKERIFNLGDNTSSPGTEKETGTGLGLILCREFVEKHGGRIWVESVVGEGSEFIFTLPINNS